jgi:Domain of unknown function (DUF4185)
MANLVGPASIIQSDFRSGEQGNFEAVLFAEGRLHHLFGSGADWLRGQTLPGPASGPGSIIQSDFRSGDHGNFEVVLYAGTELWHYFHDNSDVILPWQRAQRISAQATGPGCIIQSDFKSGDHGNFEVVVLEGHQLVHYFHDNSDVNLPWQRAQTISTKATGPGCIIQSDFRSGDHGNFEVVLLEGHELVHYFHDNSDVNLPWQRAQTISTRATGPGSIIQGPFGGQHKNFEVIVVEGNELVHYFRDNSDVNLPWQRGQTVSVAATGPGCLIKSTWGPRGPGNFEVLASELTRSVVRYWHHNVDVHLPWWRSAALPGFAEPGIDSPDFHQTIKVSQLTGEYDRQFGVPTLSRTESRFGVVGLDLGQSFEHDGRAVFLFGDTNTDNKIRRDPSVALDSIAFTADTDPSQGIRLDFNPTYPHVDNIDQGPFCVPADGFSVDRSQSGPGWVIQSDFGDEHKNFEVVALQGRELTHWWHDNSDVNVPWRRGQTISSQATGPGCIIQSDFRGDEHGNFEVVVLEGNELVHYFHDNSDVNLPWQRAQTISTRATGPGCIIQSDFRGDEHGNFEVVAPVDGRLQHFFHDNSDVGLPWQPAQTITRDSMYVFFTTDHIGDPDVPADSMGRSVLARSEDGGIHFGPPLYDLSRTKFINVSLQIVNNREFPGLPGGDGQGILLWGSGGYRRSNVYLAYLPVNRIEDRSALLYFAGLNARQQPRWLGDEALAQPLFLSGSVGEFCVRWNPFLRRFVLLYNGDNPPFVLEHQSALPWGPWTGYQNIFDADAAFGHYIHVKDSHDGLSDPSREDIGGGVYGPYLISRYTRPNGDGSTTMFFVLSVWNPYNTMLMSAVVRARD